jgi:hypothetical protein
MQEDPSNLRPSAPHTVLEYGVRPKQTLFFTQPLGVMILVSIGCFIVIALLYSAVLDGGARGRRTGADWLAYAFVAVIILIRRAKRLTKIDLAFIGFGYPLFVIVTEPFFQHW